MKLLGKCLCAAFEKEMTGSKIADVRNLGKSRWEGQILQQHSPSNLFLIEISKKMGNRSHGLI